MENILHIIKGGMIPDGIQVLFSRHLRYLSGSELRPEVLLLAPAGRILRQVSKSGIPVFYPGARYPARGLSSLLRRVRERRYSLLHCWGHAANLVSAPLQVLGKVKAIWSIHDIGASAPSVHSVEVANGWLSHTVPSRIICVAQATMALYSQRGYEHGIMRFIPNGVDCQEFKRDPEAGARMRRQLRIPAKAPVVGLIARDQVDKGVDIFIEASTLLHSRRPDVHFLLCGWNLDNANKALLRELQRRRLGGVFRLLGDREEISPVINAADVMACCSRKESFGLSVIEAMACSKPVVVSDSGDLRAISGPDALVVPVGDARAFAEGFSRLLDLSPEALAELGSRGSARVQSRYSLKRMVDQYHAIYREVL